MNPPSDNESRLTRYLLGECDEHEAALIRDHLESDPEAAAEARKIDLTIRALREGCITQDLRLSSDQRRAVLQPKSHQPRFITSSNPCAVPSRRRSTLRAVTANLLRAAAVLALCAAAFAVGQMMKTERTPVTASKVKDAEDTTSKTVFIETTRPSEVASTPQIEEEPPGVDSREAPEVEAPSPAALPKTEPPPAKLVAKTTPVATPTPTPEKPPTKRSTAPQFRSHTSVPTGFAFANASRTPTSQFDLHPADIRPPIQKVKTEVFAKPLEPSQRSKPQVDSKRDATPPIYIHSWKSEVADCPWNPEHRLLRVVIQIPAAQPAADSKDNTYPVQVKFDPHHVRDYRLLCERHIPAPELDRAGVHVLWYEFSPNGAPAQFGSVTDKPVASVAVPGAKFTTKAVGPFDDSRLIVEDPGLSWNKVRDDFAFESAVVGFGMLLRGAEQAGKLNHQLVLELARSARGDAPHPERDHFIGLVEEAQKAAGL